MKKNFKHWSIFIVLILFAVNGQAQSDITNLVLANAGFDESINFTVNGEVVHWRTSANDDPVNWGMHPLEGWKTYITADPTGCGATFEFGTESMINSVTPPPTASDGTTTGGVLGFSAGWGTQVGYLQSAGLPAGSYTLDYVLYNKGTATAGTSLTGWIPDEGDAVLSSKNNFTPDTWETDAVNFELPTYASGKIQAGFGSIAGSGSGAVAKIFIDYLKLTCNSIDKTQLSALIAEGNTLYGSGSGTKAPELRAALDAVDAVSSEEATSPALINAAVSLGYAVSQYKAQVEQETFFAGKSEELLALLDQADEIFGGHTGIYSPVALLALETAYTEASNAYEEKTLTFDNIAGYVDQLRLAIDNLLASASGLKIHYTFDNVTGNTVTNEAADEYHGTLNNEASVISMGKYKVLSLGNGTGYLDMSAAAGNILPTATNYTVSAYYRVDKAASLSGNGYFLWAFSVLETNSASAGPYVAYRLNAQRFALSTGGYSNEAGIQVGEAAIKDVWQHVLYRQTGNTGELYIDGQLIGTNAEVPLAGSAFTTPSPYNWIGRAPFGADNYLKNTLVYDFRFYNQAVETEQITEWAALVSDLNNEYDYGTIGDFSPLIAFIAECNTLLSTITIGENVGEYPQAAVWELEDAISEAQTEVDKNKASQFLIDTRLADLKAAHTAFLSAVVAGTNTLADGEYYISLNNRYLNNPGKSALANGVDLSAANSGLKAGINIVDESQIYSISKITVDAVNDVSRYSIFSTVNEADSIDDPNPYRCMTDWARYEKLELNLNWWTFDILYNQTIDAYAIYCGGDATARGYWRYIEADQRLTNQNGTTAAPEYTFKFIPLHAAFVEEVAKGRTVFAAAVVGTAADEYAQSVYDAFKTALETAEAITAGTFTKDDLFAYGAARKLFVRNDGSSAFETVIKKVKPAASNIIITGENNQIRIASAKPAKAIVYTITGTVVARKVLSGGESFIPVNPGLYIVRVAGETAKTNKVVVR
ncbi:MAG: DUF6383 domain-containing protein [Dysgonamonadaceae bacterium]|jgi:hypothetical protein|nr:DUF6383 domain-containing protein [Dysgonamonadaceae bacterium]